MAEIELFARCVVYLPSLAGCRYESKSDSDLDAVGGAKLVRREEVANCRELTLARRE